MLAILKVLVRALLKVLFRVELKGWAHYPAAEPRLLIIANHASFLDGALLSAFLPDIPVFVVNTDMAKRWWVRPLIALTRHIDIDPTSPLYIKVLIQHLKDGERVVIFPEGRITTTGALMKVYEGPVLAADKADAVILPVHIEGAQYSLLSRLGGKVRRRLFPRIRLTMLAPRRLHAPPGESKRQRRQQLGRQLNNLMEELACAGARQDCPLFQVLLEAAAIHGAGRVVIEDIRREPLSYRKLLARTFILNSLLEADSPGKRQVGILLPNSVAAVAAFLALHLSARLPVMLNFTAGARGLLTACQTAEVDTVYTSRAFVEKADLGAAVESLGRELRVVFLEDLAAGLTLSAKLTGLLKALTPARHYRRLAGPVAADDPAVMLFTSGSEGIPKGVVLTHRNLLANRGQVNAVLDLRPSDVVLNTLPMFHSFGLSTATLLPLLNGMRLFLYPSPLHYHIIPELAYDLGATILFGTNTFLLGYGRNAAPYDFYNTRLAVAGAEPLREETRRLWIDKFGLRITEGYGVTEASPVLAVNTPKFFRAGSVGRLMPGVEHYLEPVEGIAEGGRLCVRGANIMAGYRFHDRPDKLVPPTASRGEGWYDTGDIVSLDGDGFITILGRAKRFAKVGGEMVSLATVELLASHAWPEQQHAAASLPDSVKGEQIVLFTTRLDATRQELAAQARRLGVGEIYLPRQIQVVDGIPLLGSGKVDYGGVRQLAETLAQTPRRVSS